MVLDEIDRLANLEIQFHTRNDKMFDLGAEHAQKHVHKLILMETMLENNMTSIAIFQTFTKRYVYT